MATVMRSSRAADHAKLRVAEVASHGIAAASQRKLDQTVKVRALLPLFASGLWVERSDRVNDLGWFAEMLILRWRRGLKAAIQARVGVAALALNHTTTRPKLAHGLVAKSGIGGFIAGADTVRGRACLTVDAKLDRCFVLLDPLAIVGRESIREGVCEIVEFEWDVITPSRWIVDLVLEGGFERSDDGCRYTSETDPFAVDELHVLEVLIFRVATDATFEMDDMHVD